MLQPKTKKVKFDGVNCFQIKNEREGLGTRTPPSIPSKFDGGQLTVAGVLGIKESGAFGCSTKRFDATKRLKVLGPGPGKNSHQNSCKSSAASTRGYTSLLSQDPRFGSGIEILRSQLLPGPDSYYNQTSLASKPSIPQFRFGVKKHVRQKRKGQVKSCPGPGSYNVQPKSPTNNNVGAVSFRFTSRNNSNMVLQSDTEVAVGSYDVGAVYDYLERLGKEPRKGKDFPCPIFRSNSSRLAQTESLSLAPAPGYYEVMEPQDTDKLFRPSACFNYGLDRFGRSNNILIARDNEETPAPDSYYPSCAQKDNNGANASFSSKSKRFDGSECNDLTPGPQTYRPSQGRTKSFLQNRYCQWV